MNYSLRTLDKAVIAGVLVALVLVAYGPGWWEKHQAEQAEQDRRAAQAAVGMDASVDASMIYSAYQSCAVIGLPKIPDCAKDKGPLPADTAARALAAAALERHEGYRASCVKVYPAKYCDDLLSRALTVAQNQQSATQHPVTLPMVGQ